MRNACLVSGILHKLRAGLSQEAFNSESGDTLYIAKFLISICFEYLDFRPEITGS